jgi:hypothetical protein
VREAVENGLLQMHYADAEGDRKRYEFAARLPLAFTAKSDSLHLRIPSVSPGWGITGI